MMRSFKKTLTGLKSLARMPREPQILWPVPSVSEPWAFSPQVLLGCPWNKIQSPQYVAQFTGEEDPFSVPPLSGSILLQKLVD